MTDQERGAEQAGDETSDRKDLATVYEPPRLAVIGSLEELTHGAGGGGPDAEFILS
jgi:hypothetical protein